MPLRCTRRILGGRKSIDVEMVTGPNWVDASGPNLYIGTGLGTNRMDVATSASTDPVVVPVNPTNGSVFYRLRYQP